jgi:hypothetical protein
MMSNSIKFTAKKEEVRVTYENVYSDLINLKKGDDRNEFNKLPKSPTIPHKRLTIY